MSQAAPGAGGEPAGAGWGAHLGGDLVTGEAVLLELRLARFPSRALARLLDLAITLGLFLLITFLLSQADIGDDAAAAAIVLVVTIGLVVGYPLLFESLTATDAPPGRWRWACVWSVTTAVPDGSGTRSCAPSSGSWRSGSCRSWRS